MINKLPLFVDEETLDKSVQAKTTDICKTLNSWSHLIICNGHREEKLLWENYLKDMLEDINEIVKPRHVVGPCNIEDRQVSISRANGEPARELLQIKDKENQAKN